MFLINNKNNFQNDKTILEFQITLKEINIKDPNFEFLFINDIAVKSEIFFLNSEFKIENDNNISIYHFKIDKFPFDFNSDVDKFNNFSIIRLKETKSDFILDFPIYCFIENNIIKVELYSPF